MSRSASNDRLLGLSRLSARAQLGDNAVILASPNQNLPEPTIGCITCFDSDSFASLEILYADILWAECLAADDSDISPQVELTYVGSELRVYKCVLSIDTLPGSKDAATQILARAYRHEMHRKRFLVIINPHGGQGNAENLYNEQCKPLLQAAHVSVDVIKTTYQGHATAIVADLPLSQYDVIVCASGDGIPHEVVNGMRSRKDYVAAFNRWTVAQLPCGSGNAMAASCLGTVRPGAATLALLKAQERRVDLMGVSQAGQPPKLSFLSQTYGVIACSDICTEFLRFMGAVRFDLGVLYQVVRRSKFPCEISIKYACETKEGVSEFYSQRKGENPEDVDVSSKNFQLRFPDVEAPVPEDWTVVDPQVTANLGIFYSGKMPYVADGVQFFPAALPDDGTIDIVVTDARDPFTKTAAYLTRVGSGGHFDFSEVHYAKAEAFRLTPRLRDSVISVDGENFPFQALQVEVLKGVCKTLLKDGEFAETRNL
ncbi:hypothetical protein BABINDRAFT_161655 [Babjeviella inositovora NRRL Y-12698]|uniref:DAGKc domain-containing protein n=1 Tax=Babjeviella inositovora NRRL Y-12698 TaxID=984486 RepID=A0A1E3QQV0_9ASCO|nr:uncharacterized protein BABINDRAFT_161655 [Babjeviella inositovora NRRL Y-12698]ODQ80008.1 hypothetical protein BABINDRAFT_161655 [Babjeviella inositovora NRRL Y-12698]